MPLILPQFIEGRHLNEGNNDPKFGLKIPALVERLVRASLSNPPSSCRFPSFDTGQIHGYDGHLVSFGCDPYVPAGECVFEFGTNVHPVGKAEKDYKKRKSDIDPSIAKNISFVFVTSQNWPGKTEDKAEWIRSKVDENHFKTVRVIDATELVSWLRDVPAVASYAAKYIFDFTPDGFDVDDPQTFAEEFERQFSPSLPDSVILAGRESIALEIRENGFQRGITTLSADLEEEAVAFACRALLSTADVDAREERKAKTVVIRDLMSAKQLGATTDLTLILYEEAKTVASRLSQKHNVVVCNAFGQQISKDEKILMRPSIEEFSSALISGGVDREQAYDLAARCGRTLSVLRRLHPNAGADQPNWALEPLVSQTEIRAALFCGLWTERYPEDMTHLADLAGKPYSSVKRVLQPLARQADSLLTEVDKQWALRAPVDAWSRISSHIIDDDLEDFAVLVGKIFAAESLVKPDPNEILDYTSPMGISPALKRGVAQNVLLIASLGDKLGMQTKTGTCKQFAERLIRAIPNLRAHPEFLTTFARELPYLAEAAPDAFLDALEQMFEGSSESAIWLLSPVESNLSLFTYSHAQPLLWALDRLAWVPQYLRPVALILAKLAALDTSTENISSPRPLGVLASILSSWAPQTAANVEERKQALAKVIATEPLIAFDLLEQLLPQNNRIGSNHQKPIFIEVAPVPLTWADVWNAEEFISHHAINLMGSDPDRISIIVERLHVLRPGVFEEALNAIGKLANYMRGDELATVWNILRDEHARHSRFPDADWTMKTDRLEHLKDTMDLFHIDPVLAEKYLFDDYMPDIANKDWEEVTTITHDKRVKVIQGFLDRDDIEGLAEFSTIVKLPHLIAETLSSISLSIEASLRLIMACFARDENSALVWGVSRVTWEAHKSLWLLELSKELEMGRLTDSRFIKLIIAVPPDDSFTEYLKKLPKGLRTEFWASNEPRLMSFSAQERSSAITNWIEACRATDIISFLHFRENEIAATELLRIAQAAVHELLTIEGKAKRLNIHQFEKILSILDDSPEIDIRDIFRVEYPLIPALYSRRNRILAVHRIICTSAPDFMEILRKVYWSKRQETQETTPQDREIANTCFKILMSIHSSPYFEGEIDIEGFRSWAQNIMSLSDVEGLGVTARTYVGHVLAYSPSDETDGLWPHRKLRNLIEELDSLDVERGIETERFNLRGVHSDSVQFYKKHATENRDAARSMDSWPRTKALLLRIAESDDKTSNAAQRSIEQGLQDNSL